MKLSNLANVLRAAGLTVVESAGWANRGYAGQDLRQVRGVLWHHTATNRTRYAAQDAPTLSMCLNGRPDLPGPLCNIVFGRSGTVYLLAAGVANHAGAGSAPGVPANMGNHYLIGIEMESSGIAPWDWTDDQVRVAPHLGAALERAYLGWLDESERLQLGHLEYSSQGKIDPAGWPGGMDGLRASINAVLTGSGALAPQGTTTTPAPPQEEEDDMPLTIATAPDSPGKIWVGNGVHRSHVPNPKVLDGIQWLAKNKIGPKYFDDGKVQVIPAGIDCIGREIAGAPAAETQSVVGMVKGGTEIWAGDGIERRHVPNPEALEGICKLAREGGLSLYKDGETQIVASLDVLGQPATDPS